MRFPFSKVLSNCTWNLYRVLLTFSLVTMPAIAEARGRGHCIPELDAGSIGSALMLLVGGFMILKDRKRQN